MSATKHTALGPGAEFAMIDKLRHRWGSLARGVGDDAAILEVPRGEQLVASTDSMIEGVHFKRAWLSPREIGYRAVTAALSDLAAMGAAPLGVLVSLQLPPWARGGLSGIADGIGDAVKAAATVIVGGNLSRAGILGVTTTVLGHAFSPLRRTGARPGDILYVTGQLGGPAAALRAFKSGKKPGREARARFARPTARITESRWLTARGAVAAIDISDGLIADAGHLAAASAVGVELSPDRVPLIVGATMDDALSGGEEYELLIAGRTPMVEAEFRARFGLDLTAVGRVVEGPARVRMPGGKRVAARRGHDHFSR